MTTKPSDELGPDSGAYVLHALSDAENARFEAELAGSEEARAEVTELADTAVELGLSVAPVDPPAALRARILDQLARRPRSSAADRRDGCAAAAAPVRRARAHDAGRGRPVPPRSALAVAGTPVRCPR